MIGNEKLKPFSMTAAELKSLGADNIPWQFISGEHLIYSSPAALSFNSPGAEGFGVKRAALSISGSVLLLVSPGCCGRNTSGIGELPQYKNRFFFLNMDEADIVTGKHLKKVPDAVDSVVREYEGRTGKKPSVVMICITCVDALLGTDMERVCRRAEERVSLPVRPSYMYALTREGRKPPMVHIRQSLYSLLEKRRKRPSSINLLGYFAPLIEDCELYDIFRSIGVKTIREISHCADYEEFQLMAEANFNVVLDAEARPAAADLEERLGIPYIELKRLYQMDKVKSQYQALGKALNVNIDVEPARMAAREAIDTFKQALLESDEFTFVKAYEAEYPRKKENAACAPVFAVGEFMNGDPFELALSLIHEGFSVSEIFGTISTENFIYIEKLAELSPGIRIYSNLDPSIIHYDEACAPHIDFTIGKDAAYYHPHAIGIQWKEDIQPFGFAGIKKLFTRLLEAYRSQSINQSNFSEGISTQNHSNTTDPTAVSSSCARIRGLRRFLPPFAPDASGASSVLYSLGGITVICDAGGCAGNICGFDEPRWLSEKSAIYSAGLRDMDAILGRDDRLVEKLKRTIDSVGSVNVNFAAIIGTPVPAVIATDYHALKRMTEKRTGIRTLSIDTSGMELYDVGAEKAYMELFCEFADDADGRSAAHSYIGILGATPLDTGMLDAKDFFRRNVRADFTKYSAATVVSDTKDSGEAQKHDACEILCFGMGDGLAAIRQVRKMSKNIVIAPSAIKVAEYLKKRFGTPYEIGFPGAKELLEMTLTNSTTEQLFTGKRVLIIHQHVLALSLADIIKDRSPAKVRTASWFKLVPERDGIRLHDEADLTELIRDFKPDIIISDNAVAPLVNEAGSTAALIDLPHFAVSGRLLQTCTQKYAALPVTKRIRVYGIVQGVGFRPTVSRHAAAAGIRGTVCNKGPYVEIIAQGSSDECDTFLELLKTRPPRRAAILKIDVRELAATPAADIFDSSVAIAEPLRLYKDFSIIESEKTRGSIYISPDIAICDDCKRELFDKNDRRYLHPFINCTNCGPRMTILDALPYDRERTSMKFFPMCGQCSSEYHSPESRRYDAQPVCCNDCGPSVYILDTLSGKPSAKLTGRAAITHARKTIAGGGIVAVKGIGGFHLCCDAKNERAVSLLRSRKHRPAKPFAVMMRDMETVKRECLVSSCEEELLTGHQKTIVLLVKKSYACAEYSAPDDSSLKNIYAKASVGESVENSGIMPSVAPGVAPIVAPDNPKLGVMLPYAPIQLLLFDYDDGISVSDCLVMTSANESGAPICRDDADALKELPELADAILSNDRPIRIRADDTVTDFYKDEPYMIRRSRGFAPLPLLINALSESPLSVIGMGGELKNSFCIGKGQLFYPSPYVGDLGDIRTVDALRETIKRFMTLLEAKPQAICCDMHPLYQSRKLAYELAGELSADLSAGLQDASNEHAYNAVANKASIKAKKAADHTKIQVFEIQHHYAHILSCMAENDREAPVIGVSFDGTGYGTDKTIWGGEILICDWNGFERFSHISPFIQVGGDLSSKEGWRIAAQMIGDIYDTAEKKCAGHKHAEAVISSIGLCSPQEFKLIDTMAKRNINSVKSTSAGRLFDAISAILGIKRISTFEGEASSALMYKAMEYAAIQNRASSCDSIQPDDKEYVEERKKTPEEHCSYKYPLLTDEGVLNTKDLVRFIIDETADRDAESYSTARLSYLFHKLLSEMIAASVSLAAEKTGVRTAALSGGVFQNTLLLGLTEEALKARDIQVLRHHLIPPNDGGIGLGQAVYAMKHAALGYSK